MEDIFKIYDNKIGISFQWKEVQSNLTQVIFRDTGFHLSEDEIALFIEKIIDAKQQKTCFRCEAGEYCKSILLQTPSNKVSMAVSLVELGQIEDLLRGTLFQLKLNGYLNDICKN